MRIYNMQQSLPYVQPDGDTNITISKASGPLLSVIDTTTGLQTRLVIHSNHQNHGVWSTGYYDGSTYTTDGRWLIRRGSSGAAATDCSSFYINGNKASVASMSLSGTTLTITDPSIT